MKLKLFLFIYVSTRKKLFKYSYKLPSTWLLLQLQLTETCDAAQQL